MTQMLPTATTSPSSWRARRPWCERRQSRQHRGHKVLVMPSPEDSVLRAQMEGDGEYAVTGRAAARGARCVKRSSLATPVEGIITDRFDIRTGAIRHPYCGGGPDRIAAVDNGTVVLSLWTPERATWSNCSTPRTTVDLQKLSQSMVTNGQTSARRADRLQTPKPKGEVETLRIRTLEQRQARRSRRIHRLPIELRMKQRLATTGFDRFDRRADARHRTREPRFFRSAHADGQQQLAAAGGAGAGIRRRHGGHRRQTKYTRLRARWRTADVKVYAGRRRVRAGRGGRDTDVVVNALVGYAGLRPTVAASKRARNSRWRTRNARRGRRIRDAAGGRKACADPTDRLRALGDFPVSGGRTVPRAAADNHLQRRRAA